LAEIRMFGFNFAPTGWAQCNGQLLPISQNTALFALLGTVYGGDGKSTFALPDLQSSTTVHRGQGQGLSEYFLGQQGGAPFVTLLESEMPVHSHAYGVTEEAGASNNPGNNAPGAGSAIYATPAAVTQMAAQTLMPAGGSLPHNNMMPYLVVNFCIAMQGIFPQRP
jgi:microcystin-dependent protein